MVKMPDECMIFANREEWRAWLEAHHSTEQEAWLYHFKKKAAGKSLSYEEAVEEALCFGWIDGILRGIDEQKYALRYSPRKPRSVWAESNKQRVEKLITEGRMTAAGLEKVAQAKANGEWDAATTREDTSAVPADLAEALSKHDAGASFDRWPASRKKQYLHWLSSAKRAETRQKRIQAIVEMASSKE